MFSHKSSTPPFSSSSSAAAAAALLVPSMCWSKSDCGGAGTLPTCLHYLSYTLNIHGKQAHTRALTNSAVTASPHLSLFCHFSFCALVTLLFSSLVFISPSVIGLLHCRGCDRGSCYHRSKQPCSAPVDSTCNPGWALCYTCAHKQV